MHIGKHKVIASLRKPTRNVTTVSLSFTVPLEFENQINQAAANYVMNRSQYIYWLAVRDIRANHPEIAKQLKPGTIPPRIRRKEGTQIQDKSEHEEWKHNV
jgi:hypothetical protein